MAVGRAVEYAQLLDLNLKRCTKCRDIKPLDQFSPRSNFKGDLQPRSRCKPCCSKVVIELREAGYNRLKTLSRYGLTQQKFNNLVKQQASCCAICKCEPEQFCIDHDHKTGKVRGLLCFGCNVSLGHFNDSITNLESAIIYLRRTSE